MHAPLLLWPLAAVVGGSTAAAGCWLVFAPASAGLKAENGVFKYQIHHSSFLYLV